jgi:hypothetical protein
MRCGRAERAAVSRLGLAAVLAAAVTPAIHGNAQEVLRVGEFSTLPAPGPVPAPWQLLPFRGVDRKTVYGLVRDPDRGTVVRAVADASAAGLAREVDVDPRAFPVVRWRWRADSLVQKGDALRREGDDYPVRLYVTFAVPLAELPLFERVKVELIRLFYGRPPPLAAVSYVWDRSAPVGTVVPNAYTAQVRMFVVETGAARLGTWIEYERDVREDYRRAFGRDPPRINGVGLMTDTDNTGERVQAFYGDVEFVAAR